LSFERISTRKNRIKNIKTPTDPCALTHQKDRKLSNNRKQCTLRINFIFNSKTENYTKFD